MDGRTRGTDPLHRPLPQEVPVKLRQSLHVSSTVIDPPLGSPARHEHGSLVGIPPSHGCYRSATSTSFLLLGVH